MIFRTGNSNTYSGYGVLILIFICTSFCSCQEFMESNNVSKKEVIADNCHISPNSNSLDNSLGLVTFLDELKQIVHTNDFNRLCELLDSKVTVSYGEALYGKNEFIKYWKDGDNQEQLWNTLNRILALGGDLSEYESEEAYILPYTQTDRFYDGITVDWFSLATVVSSQAYLYDETLQRTVDTLNYDIVEIVDQSNPKFTRIKTVCNDKNGWILNEDIYVCTDYSLVLARDKNEEWRIKVFSTG